jgi:hypothetical protein
VAAVDLALRINLEAYDAHDDVLDAEDARLTAAQPSAASSSEVLVGSSPGSSTGRARWSLRCPPSSPHSAAPHGLDLRPLSVIADLLETSCQWPPLTEQT